MTYYLAIDIGASSGRHILGYVENGAIKTEEVYRFKNGYKQENGSLVWDTEHLFNEVKNGIKICSEICKAPKTVAIDTWGVDYVLLDENKKELLPCYCYRDSRTGADVLRQVSSIISSERQYEITGIQKQNYNTVFQLYCDKSKNKLETARHFLMMPEYLSFKLTGEVKNEYTEATTTGMVRAETKQWDEEILSSLGYDKALFQPLSAPCTKVGDFTEELQKELGFNCEVIFAPSHDTASAVAACPMGEDELYISSGTWSLIGTESKTPIITADSFNANFANEGGIDYRFRFLKNYMGMWLLQGIHKDLGGEMTYDEMMHLAEDEKDYEYLDVNYEGFTAPDSMLEAVRKYCGKPDMSLGSVIASIYHSLAKTYKLAAEEIESITGKEIKAIHIVGGGSKDDYLNRLTAEYTGKPVTAGPTEATAIGNLISQLIYDGVCENLTEARKLVIKSFNISEVKVK